MHKIGVMCTVTSIVGAMRYLRQLLDRLDLGSGQRVGVGSFALPESRGAQDSKVVCHVGATAQRYSYVFVNGLARRGGLLHMPSCVRDYGLSQQWGYKRYLADSSAVVPTLICW